MNKQKNNLFIKPSGRILCRFSCGAASAVATKLAIEKYGKVMISYSDTNSEHSDNERFIKDCEKWFGSPVTKVRSARYKDIWDVFEKKRFLSSPHGAPCTSEMKRIPGEAVWELGDTEIFGYTKDEQKRLDQWRKNNPERIIECPLIDQGITKQDCFDILRQQGIEIPVMYKLGFRNNNCIGCVKARDNLNYWKRIRKFFPEHFAKMSRLEREIGLAINRTTKKGVRSPIYLDEIPPGEPKGGDPNIQCGLFCSVNNDETVEEWI